MVLTLPIMREMRFRRNETSVLPGPGGPKLDKNGKAKWCEKKRATEPLKNAIFTQTNGKVGPAGRSWGSLWSPGVLFGVTFGHHFKPSKSVLVHWGLKNRKSWKSGPKRGAPGRKFEPKNKKKREAWQQRNITSASHGKL